jgi:hypothetical protein
VQATLGVEVAVGPHRGAVDHLELSGLAPGKHLTLAEAVPSRVDSHPVDAFPK